MCKSLIIFIILLSIFVMLNIFALTQLLLDFFFCKNECFYSLFLCKEHCPVYLCSKCVCKKGLMKLNTIYWEFMAVNLSLLKRKPEKLKSDHERSTLLTQLTEFNKNCEFSIVNDRVECTFLYCVRAMNSLHNFRRKIDKFNEIKNNTFQSSFFF